MGLRTKLDVCQYAEPLSVSPGSSSAEDLTKVKCSDDFVNGKVVLEERMTEVVGLICWRVGNHSTNMF